jgi:hypothetical protein
MIHKIDSSCNSLSDMMHEIFWVTDEATEKFMTSSVLLGILFQHSGGIEGLVKLSPEVAPASNYSQSGVHP